MPKRITDKMRLDFIERKEAETGRFVSDGTYYLILSGGEQHEGDTLRQAIDKAILARRNPV